jgi:hypothetical protein
MRRSSKMLCAQKREGDRVVNVRVGGNEIEVMRAEVFLELTARNTRKILARTGWGKRQWPKSPISIGGTLQARPIFFSMHLASLILHIEKSLC